MPTLPLTGGCLCGALRYRISAPPLFVYNCHCTNCQRTGGGAFATNLVVARESFELVRGDPSRTNWKSDAGTERFGWFCGDCGGRILHGQEVPPVVTVRSGTLDDTSWVTPVGDLWIRSAQPWVELSKKRLNCERQPTDFGPYLEAFRALGIRFESQAREERSTPERRATPDG